MSDRTAILRNVVLGAIIVALWSLISLDGNAEQVAFNRTEIVIAVCALMVYLTLAVWMPGNSVIRRRFVRFGGVGLILGAQIIYCAVKSVIAGRFL